MPNAAPMSCRERSDTVTTLSKRLATFFCILKKECQRRISIRSNQELAAFKDLRPEIGMGLGVVDIKATDIESADQIARAIEHAEAVIGEGRIRYIHPDCGFWMLKRNIADGKIRALVQGRDLYEGRT